MITFPGFLLLPLPILAGIAIALIVLAGLYFLFGILQIQVLYSIQKEPVSCPKCGSRDVRKSRPMGSLDELRKRIGLCPFRCRGCFSRFVCPKTEKTALEEAMEHESSEPLS